MGASDERNILEPIDLAAIREGRIDVIGEIKPRDWGSCRHMHHVVNQELRRVTCKECGETLDPIEVIIQYVQFWRRTAEQLTYLTKLQREQRERSDRRFKASEQRRMVKRVKTEGGTWACTVDGRQIEYWNRDES